jgi:hypothetical protein
MDAADPVFSSKINKSTSHQITKSQLENRPVTAQLVPDRSGRGMRSSTGGSGGNGSVRPS